MPLVFLILIVIMFSPYITASTLEVTSKPTHDDCRHVTVTSWFGLNRLFDGELCGDKKVDISIMGRSIDSETLQE